MFMNNHDKLHGSIIQFIIKFPRYIRQDFYQESYLIIIIALSFEAVRQVCVTLVH